MSSMSRKQRARRAGLPAAARDGREDRAPRRLGHRPHPALRVRQGDGIARAPEAIHPIVTGGAGYKMSYLPIWGGGSQTVMRKV
jgi:hypothetical protein